MMHPLEQGIRSLVEQFIESGRPCPSLLDIEQRRQGYVASCVFAGEGPEMAEVLVDELDGILIKVFKPTLQASLPITVYFHGGCFISGGFDTHDQQLKQLAKLSGSIVICIRYRLAPEHVYPAAHDDVYKAATLIKQSGEKYGGDTSRITFVGDSAGAQLALITSLRLKAQQDWLPSKQILIYPMLDPTGSSESYRQNGDDYIITAKMLLSGFDMYTGELPRQEVANNPELSPLNRANFTGLPPTNIITAQFDPLRDEGEVLYERLMTFGVEATCQRYFGVVHGFHQLSAVSESAKQCLRYIAEQIKQG